MATTIGTYMFNNPRFIKEFNDNNHDKNRMSSFLLIIWQKKEKKL